jgi:tetratricopeptide (TPR) repeat protein
LSAIDEAVHAQLLRPGANSETFDFTHALIRHTLYSGLSPVRRVRLHRKIAEAMERAWGERSSEHAAEVAYQFWRGAEVAGTARGADYAIAAANNAEAAYAHDEVVAFLRIALELLPRADARRPRLQARLGLALTWTLEAEESVKVAREAGELIAATEGSNAAAEYYETAARALHSAGLHRWAWGLATEGLRHAGETHDITWASLREIDLFRENAEDLENPGIRPDTPGQRAWRAVLRVLPRQQLRTLSIDPGFESRSEIIDAPDPNPLTLLQLAGEYRRSLTLWQQEAGEAESRGRIAWAVTAWANAASAHIALGDLAAARAALDRAAALSARASASAPAGLINMNVMGAHHEMRIASDDGWAEMLQNAGAMGLLEKPAPENRWAFAMVNACAAYFFARINQTEMALHCLQTVVPALERGAFWDPTYSASACDVAAALWLLERSDFIDVVERCIREKVVLPDFRYPMRDGRLSIARLCALQGRHEEAVEWFGKAREVLDEQGARPLRAIVDYDEALMYIRRAGVGDAKRAEPIFDLAMIQFRALGMTGWIQRVEQAREHPIAQ